MTFPADALVPALLALAVIIAWVRLVLGHIRAADAVQAHGWRLALLLVLPPPALQTPCMIISRWISAAPIPAHRAWIWTLT